MPQLRRPAAPRAVALHIVHLAVSLGREPVQQMRFVARQIDRRDADLLKAKLSAPALDLRGESGVVDRLASGTGHRSSILVQ